jgi:LPXTG-motif cell wall-anchored protein
MKPKTVIAAIVLAFVVLILFYNKEESSLWLFGEIRTSKLIILGVFYILGVITGGFLFRRKRKHPKEYAVTNTNNAVINPTDTAPDQHEQNPYSTDRLTDEDREFIRKD